MRARHLRGPLGVPAPCVVEVSGAERPGQFGEWCQLRCPVKALVAQALLG